MTRRLSLSARNSPLFLLLSLIHRKAASSQLLRLFSPNSLQEKKPQTREGFPPTEMFSSEEHRVEVEGGGRSTAAAIRRSLWRFSIPSVSCEAAWNWPRSWPASAGLGRASSAQSHSWQWSSWRRKHWRCLGYAALREMKKEGSEEEKCQKRHLLCTWCSFFPSKFRCSRTERCLCQ